MGPAVAADLPDEIFAELVQQVYQHTGITLSDRKRALVKGRVKQRMRALRVEAYADYLELLQSQIRGPGEVEFFIDAVTTNLTSFFRTPRIWRYFYNNLLPDWVQVNSDKPIRIWSAAAASGEEPYSIALLCSEFSKRYPDFRWSLLATDISHGMLKRARDGVYSLESLRKGATDFGFLNLQKYFKVDSGKAQVLNELRSIIDFRQHHLFQDPPDGEFDVVFLRNVLIYFSMPDKERVLQQASRAMKASSTIFVGETETLLKTNCFQYIQPSIYRKQSGIAA